MTERAAAETAPTPDGTRYELDRDTTCVARPDAPGVLDTTLSADWAFGMGVNGGYLLALAARALGTSLPQPDPFTITAHYPTASHPGPAEVHTEVLHAGRTLATGTARIVQDGRTRVHVTGTYGDLDALDAEVRTSARPPEFPSLAECAANGALPAAFRRNAFMHRSEQLLDPATVRWAAGEPSGRGEIRAWWRLADGRDPDPLALLLAVDSLAPTAFDLGLRGWVPTVELTVHVRARPVPGWLRVSLRTRNLAGGFLEEDGEVWDAAGRLVAQSRQLARAPRRREA
ncbi:TesB-like acyl-CoA thioesterase 3 [Embleya scabrispora]|uniref:TesB-like acyl-CoA thioesterase 3 n=1 Tax=Embleya scabrispora TaxID=159449 RepID=A0A1T3P8F5_9ACTN|nr:thioesterase family protein [Embleya scabrispora]OPC85386.1 TesB-like acyl-CoA thioesterase 3 [Embleya scabrispora]